MYLIIRSHLFALALLASIVIPGCRNASSENLAREALQGEARVARDSAGQIKNITVKNWGAAGLDSQRRPLWRLNAREGRIGEGDSLAPRRATLLGARAELFRDGVLQSSFQAEKIELITTPQGQRLLLSGGVEARTPPPASARLKSGDALSSAPLIVRAPRAEVGLKSRNVWIPSSATVEQKGSGVRVSAKTLRGNSSLKTLNLEGDVIAVSPRGRVRADRATYNWSARRLLALGNVRAQAPVDARGGATTNVILTGDRLDADAPGASGRLSGKVRAVGSGGSASSGSIAFNWRTRTLRAQNDVSLQKDGASFAASEIETDADFSRATATGNVKLSKDGATMSASRVQAFDKFTRAIASGNVRMSKGTASLSASRVESFNNFARAIASGGVSLSQNASGARTTVRAARVEAFDDFSRARASGEVRLTQGNATVRAANLEAFDLKGAGRAAARGGVELRRDDLVVNAPSVDAANLRDRAALVVAASGGVRARSGQGRVSSERVRWANGRVDASGNVTMQRGNLSLGGQSLSSDDNFENAILTGSVRSTSQGASVTASRIEKRGARIVATGGVRAVSREVTVRAPRVEASEGSGDVLASGGVTLTTRDGATLRAPNARYSKARDEAYAQNGVRYIDPKKGLNLSGRSVVVRRVSDEVRRVAVIEGIGGSTSSQVLKGLKF